ncbi:hypothetical protein Tco_0780195 [Tanacetum coccineum]
MVVLESCPKYNMVAYLEKTDKNAEFHEIIDFLTRSSIHHALTTQLPNQTIFDDNTAFGKVTPLLAFMLVQPTEDEGAPSERPSEAQPTPSPPHPSAADFLGGNHEDSHPVINPISGNEDQEAQEASQTCYHTPQSRDEECLIEAKIGRKEILKEKLC